MQIQQFSEVIFVNTDQSSKGMKISKSTISKALNHCYGVNSDLRECILNDYSHKATRKSVREVDIYVIVPETPRYFWRCKLPKVSDPDIKVKYNIISRPGDTSVILHYLKEAETLDAKAIVLVSLGNPQVEKEIERLSQGRLIIYLNNLNETKNTFFIGPDPQGACRALAEVCQKHHPGSTLLLISSSKSTLSPTFSKKISAFVDTIEGKIPYDILSVPVNSKSSSFPAAVSRALAEYLEKERFGSVVCLDGYTSKVCSALRKLKNVTGHSALCFGFENDPQNEPFAESGILKAVIYSNFQEQINLAMKKAEDYVLNGNFPHSKYSYTQHYIKIY